MSDFNMREIPISEVARVTYNKPEKNMETRIVRELTPATLADTFGLTNTQFSQAKSGGTLNGGEAYGTIAIDMKLIHYLERLMERARKDPSQYPDLKGNIVRNFITTHRERIKREMEESKKKEELAEVLEESEVNVQSLLKNIEELYDTIGELQQRIHRLENGDVEPLTPEEKWHIRKGVIELLDRSTLSIEHRIRFSNLIDKAVL